MDDQNKPVNSNDEMNQVSEEKALPNPMDRPELMAPKQEHPPVIIKKGMFSNPFVSTMFLVAFFLVSFALGTYVEKNNKFTTALAQNGAIAGAQNAQAGGQAPSVGLEDGEQVTTEIKGDAARTKGNPNAKVTIYEFSDFECPFCEAFYSQAYKDIVKKYVDAGQVKIVFKDFPLSFHPMAQSAAEAARCAQEQGKFWEMHDKLFENQKDLSADNYKKWAASIGVDTQKFNTCVDTNKYKQAVTDDLNEGVALGVQGTPSFVINGTALVGAQPITAFETLIEQKLK